MLFSDCEMVNEFLDQVKKDESLDTFCDAFSEFIYQLAQVDLSKETLDDLFQIFLKDQKIYFNNKRRKEMEEKKVCSICGKEFEGFGNNAWPVNDGTCCDERNATKVIPTRITEITKRNIEES